MQDVELVRFLDDFGNLTEPKLLIRIGYSALVYMNTFQSLSPLRFAP